MLPILENTCGGLSTNQNQIKYETDSNSISVWSRYNILAQ